MKATEVRAMSVEDLEKKLADLKKDLFNLRLQNATNQLENPNRINDVKKTSPGSRPSSVRSRPLPPTNLKEEFEHGEQNFFP